MSVEKTTPTLLRKEGRTYTTLPNDSIALIHSGDALAIWTYLQSKPQNWVVRKSDIMDKLDIGRVRYGEAMNHLRDIGLVAAAPNQGEDGKITGRVLICFDSPKYTEPSISVSPKYTETEIDGSAKFAEPSPLVIKKNTSSNEELLKTENNGKTGWHPSHSDKPPEQAPAFPEKPTHWRDVLLAERMKKLNG